MPKSETDGSTDDQRSKSAASHDAVLASAWRCIQHALSTQLRDDAKTRDLYASDALFRGLHDCVTEHTGVLRALGDDENTIITLLLRTLDEAAAPGEPHPALRGAIEDWTRQAYRAKD